jgi:hypothetical protein
VENGNELYERVLRVLKCVINKMLSNTWQETEYHLQACCAVNDAHIGVYWSPQETW